MSPKHDPTSLPRPTQPFAGQVAPRFENATPAPLLPHRPIPDSPNILLILLDDVGFGTTSTFGGPVPTPALDRIASAGLRYNQFHTTALCSPTRAAMLTGRNHHRVHMGAIPEGANSYPGYDSVLPPEAATVASVLQASGYATGCFGKWHLTPTWEQGPAGPFDRWPTGQGFDRFYGILSAEASQWEPPVYDQTTPVVPYIDKPTYHLTEDLADRTIDWIDQVRTTRPDTPWFAYFSTGAMHCPHHVAPEWSDRFAGQFDAGWDELRAQIFEQQLELGVIPAGTALTPRPDQVPGWDDYPDRYKPVASRLMEVFAGFMAHTDAQIGRILAHLDAIDAFNNTLVIYITGDNGASGEGTIHGAWSAPSFQNGIPEDPEWLLEHIDDFGTARCENHYNVGWAWALDAPFQWMKQVASHFGGTRNGMALSWPKRITDAGGLRRQFHHVIDVASTIYEATGIQPPSHMNGIEQLPIDGTSMMYSFDGAAADISAVPSQRTTQYFEILGNRGVYHDGWMASCFHGRPPWIRLQGLPFDGPQERWELYNIDADFSQSRDLANQYPEKLAELREVFDQEAAANGAYPLRDPGMLRSAQTAVPTALGQRTSMHYSKIHVRVPEGIVVNLKNCSYRITGNITVPAIEPAASGVIACQGGNMAGWSLYLDEDSRPTYHYNWFGHEHTTITAPRPLEPGDHRVVVEFAYEGGFGGGGTAALLVDGEFVAHGHIPKTVPLVYSISGETFDIGVDTGAPVGPYGHGEPTHRHGFAFTGSIHDVHLERLTEPPPEIIKLVEAGMIQAHLASQ
jgi:arylsulfatase A-like enzyme